jgi:hypothetical protein
MPPFLESLRSRKRCYGDPGEAAEEAEVAAESKTTDHVTEEHRRPPSDSCVRGLSGRVLRGGHRM